MQLSLIFGLTSEKYGWQNTQYLLPSGEDDSGLPDMNYEGLFRDGTLRQSVSHLNRNRKIPSLSALYGELVAATIEIMTTINELSGVLKSTWKHPHKTVLDTVCCNKLFEFFKNMYLLPCEK